MPASAQEDAFDRLNEALQDSNCKKAVKCADAGANRFAADVPLAGITQSHGLQQ